MTPHPTQSTAWFVASYLAGEREGESMRRSASKLVGHTIDAIFREAFSERPNEVAFWVWVSEVPPSVTPHPTQSTAWFVASYLAPVKADKPVKANKPVKASKPFKANKPVKENMPVKEISQSKK